MILLCLLFFLVISSSADIDNTTTPGHVHQFPIYYSPPSNTGVKPSRPASRRLSTSKYENDVSLLEGYMYTTISVGSPPKRFSVIVDTGSEDLIIPCSGCVNCGKHMDAPFNTRDSTTSTFLSCSKSSECSTNYCVDNKCYFRDAYQEGSSLSGEIVNDVVCLGEQCVANPKARLNFGCASRLTNKFKLQKADGIMGFNDKPQSFLNQMNKLKLLKQNIFSFCFARSGGHMSIGGYNKKKHLQNVQWTAPMNYGKSGLYYLRTETISVGGEGTVGHYERVLIDTVCSSFHFIFFFF